MNHLGLVSSPVVHVIRPSRSLYFDTESTGNVDLRNFVLEGDFVVLLHWNHEPGWIFVPVPVVFCHLNGLNGSSAAATRLPSSASKLYVEQALRWNTDENLSTHGDITVRK